MAKKKAKKHKHDASGLAIPAGLFIGMGIGFMTGELVGWLFVGLGLGFLVMLLANYKKGKK